MKYNLGTFFSGHICSRSARPTTLYLNPPSEEEGGEAGREERLYLDPSAVFVHNFSAMRSRANVVYIKSLPHLYPSRPEEKIKTGKTGRKEPPRAAF